jgi:hypothetical protein
VELKRGKVWKRGKVCGLKVERLNGWSRCESSCHCQDLYVLISSL